MATATSFSKKLRTLFWLFISNFALPVLLSVAQLVVYLASPDDYQTAEYIEQINDHFTIICVVFATVWAFEGSWKEGRSRHTQLSGWSPYADDNGEIESEMQFRMRGPQPHPAANALYDKKPQPASSESDTCTSSNDLTGTAAMLTCLDDASGELGRLDLHGTVLSRIGQAI